MRSACRELPGMPRARRAASATRSRSCVHLSLLDLAGPAPRRCSARRCASASSSTSREHLGDPQLSVDAIAAALNVQPPPSLQRLRRRARRRRRLHPGAPPRRLPPRASTTAPRPPLDHRHRARLRLLEHGALQPRLPGPARGCAPSDYRRAGAASRPEERVEGRGSLAAVVIRDPGGMLAHAARRDRAPAPQLAPGGRPFAAEQGRPLARHRQCPLRRGAVALVGQVGEATVGAGVVVGAERRAPRRRSAAPGSASRAAVSRVSIEVVAPAGPAGSAIARTVRTTAATSPAPARSSRSRGESWMEVVCTLDTFR